MLNVPRRMSKDDLRHSISALIALTTGAVETRNEEVAAGLGEFIKLIVKATYHPSGMTAHEWEEIDILLAHYREAAQIWEVERTNHAGISGDELDGSDSNDGSAGTSSHGQS